MIALPPPGLTLIPAALLLGGLLALDAGTGERWSWSGTWGYPIGRPEDFLPGRTATTGVRLLRGFDGSARDPHRGADLGGPPGAVVRAGGHGLVVQAVRGDTLSAWGDRVVVAHRLEDGRLAYSVYAHLLPGSIRVRARDRVRAGQPIARVGRSGNATTPHLHFELRLGPDPAVRWEKAEAVDPIDFVSRRLGSYDGRSDVPGVCLRWAEQGALIPAGTAERDTLRRSRWWTMLARAARHGLERLPASADSLAPILAATGLIGHREGAAEEAPSWSELESDLRRLRRRGLRLPAVPLPAARLTPALSARFGIPGHGQDLARAATVEDAVLLIAGLAGPEPAPRRRRPR